AAGSHFTKAGTRAVINTSPEPFSNWTASLAEDVAVGGLLWLAIAHPLGAAIAVVLLIGLMLWLLPKAWRAARRLVARLRGGLSAGPPRLRDPQR
ncbi:MAG: DUF4126 domain-containing protein, partial [Betaproteobacteria bacterium]